MSIPWDTRMHLHPALGLRNRRTFFQQPCRLEAMNPFASILSFTSHARVNLIALFFTSRNPNHLLSMVGWSLHVAAYVFVWFDQYLQRVSIQSQEGGMGSCESWLYSFVSLSFTPFWHRFSLYNNWLWGVFPWRTSIEKDLTIVNVIIRRLI